MKVSHLRGAQREGKETPETPVRTVPSEQDDKPQKPKPQASNRNSFIDSAKQSVGQFLSSLMSGIKPTSPEPSTSSGAAQASLRERSEVRPR